MEELKLESVGTNCVLTAEKEKVYRFTSATANYLMWVDWLYIGGKWFQVKEFIFEFFLSLSTISPSPSFLIIVYLFLPFQSSLQLSQLKIYTLHLDRSNSPLIGHSASSLPLNESTLPDESSLSSVSKVEGHETNVRSVWGKG